MMASNILLISLLQDVQVTNKGHFMKSILLTPIIVFFFIIALCSAAGAWELDKVGVEAKIQEVKRYEWIKEHTHTKERIYVFNDPQAIADREFAEAVNKLGEKYVRR